MFPRAWKVLQTFWVAVIVPILTPVKLPLTTPFPDTCAIEVKFLPCSSPITHNDNNSPLT